MARDSDHGVPIETPVAGTNKVVMTRIEVADIFRPTTQMPPLFGEGTTDEPLVIEEVVPAVTAEHRALPTRDSLVGLEVVDLRMSGLVPIEDRVSAPVELADDLAAVASTSAPVKPLSSDSTAPLSLSQVEHQSMSAIARVNDAVLSGVLDPSSSPVAGVFGAAAATPIPVDELTDTTTRNRDASTSLGVAPLEPATTVRAPFVIDTPVQRWSPLPRSQPTPVPDPTAADVPLSRHERTAMLALDPSSGMPRSGPWQALAAVARSLRSVRWWLRRRKITKTTRVKPLAP